MAPLNMSNGDTSKSIGFCLSTTVGHVSEIWTEIDIYPWFRKESISSVGDFSNTG